ncbi:MAG TPA: phosphatidylserine decarboxylase [Casimicrobiaceae bacterium]|jgi:phosphatidylserine decarboxylase|nr:phosphatidylserine decarboxylase [Casimicrobiaceae bacterium]
MAAVDYPHPIIAREGWFFVGLALLVAAALTLLGWWLLAILAWAAVLFIVQFFRDPARAAPDNPKAVLSPADGRVVAVERTRDSYLERDALKISVFMNVFNVHSNRSPVDGTVKSKWYHTGSFLNASLDKASLENERCALHIASAPGHDVTCVQIAGLVARRVLCYAGQGDRLVRGQRYGFIRFGSRVDIYLPPGASPRVAIGDKVYATSSTIAELT